MLPVIHRIDVGGLDHLHPSIPEEGDPDFVDFLLQRSILSGCVEVDTANNLVDMFPRTRTMGATDPPGECSDDQQRAR